MSEEQDTSQAPEEPAIIEAPADLTALSDVEFSALASEVELRGRELATRAAQMGILPEDEHAEALTIGELADAIDVERSRREEAASELAARQAQALGRFAAAEPEPTAEPEAALSNDDTPADDGGDESAEPADPGDDGDAELAQQPEPRRSFRGASPAFLRGRSSDAAPPDTRASAEFMTATADSLDPEGTVYDSPAAVAAAIYKKVQSFSKLRNPGAGALSIAHARKQFPEGHQKVGGLEPRSNLAALRGTQNALVASGECCTPQSPLYDFWNVSEPIRDVEMAIPARLADRGGMAFIQAVCDRTTGAVGLYDCEDRAAIDSETGEPAVEKPCARVPCPDIDQELVTAVTACMIFDNLQYDTFPELIEDFQERVAVDFALTKQRFLLDAIDAESTHTVGIGSYGAARSVLYDWTVAAAGYRKRNRMPYSAELDLLAPDWLLDVVRLDLLNDGDTGTNWLNAPAAAITEAVRARGLNVTWVYDDTTDGAAANTLAQPQAGSGAALNDFPAVASSYLYAPGTFVRLDGGTLDVGIIRDLQLVKTNDFAMFFEEYMALVMLGCESVRIDSTVCPSGARAPFAAALRTCPTPS